MNRTLTLLLVAVVIAACGGAAGITETSTCREYLAADGETRSAAVRTIGSEMGLEFAGNPMMFATIDSACGENPDRVIGDMFNFMAGGYDEDRVAELVELWQSEFSRIQRDGTLFGRGALPTIEDQILDMTEDVPRETLPQKTQNVIRQIESIHEELEQGDN